MNVRSSLLWIAASFPGAMLSAQPPADFEASVKAAMAPSIAQQRAAVQKQASAMMAAKPGGAASSFFIVPFPATAPGAADCDPLPREQLDPLVDQAAANAGVEARLVRAVIDQESGGRPCALSARGAEGLMQLMPATADQYDVDDPFDPKQNVEAGAKLLKSLLDRYQNDPSLALGAYNAGSTRVDQAGGVPAIPETMDYVTAVLEKLRILPPKSAGTGVGTIVADPAPTSMKNSGWQTAPLGFAGDLNNF
jgi:soluble lytic murein transglycosylase-like protein